MITSLIGHGLATTASPHTTQYEAYAGKAVRERGARQLRGRHTRHAGLAMRHPVRQRPLRDDRVRHRVRPEQLRQRSRHRVQELHEL